MIEETNSSKRTVKAALRRNFIAERRFLFDTLRESQCTGQTMRHNSRARQLNYGMHQGRRRYQTSNTYKASRALGMQNHGKEGGKPAMQHLQRREV
jgi:hypothetical protein